MAERRNYRRPRSSALCILYHDRHGGVGVYGASVSSIPIHLERCKLPSDSRCFINLSSMSVCSTLHGSKSVYITKSIYSDSSHVNINIVAKNIEQTTLLWKSETSAGTAEYSNNNRTINRYLSFTIVLLGRKLPGVGGSPFGYKERSCWANCPCN